MTTDKRSKCPISIAILGWLYIAVGVLTTAAHYEEFRTQKPMLNEVVWITVLGLAAVVSGAFMLSGRSWARWLALAWMAAHVAISAIHPHYDLIVHSVLLVLIGYLLLRREAQAFFSPE